MLREIYIENLAVIRKACITLKDGLNAFTGETGAGKSILIGGINAILGQRVYKDIVRAGCEKAVVSALFSDVGEDVCEILSQNGFDVDSAELILTREIRADGGSVARINSRTAPVSLLKEVGSMLVNIHGQHDSQVLLSPQKHLAIVEDFSGDYTLLEEYKTLFRQLQNTAKQLKLLKNAEAVKTQQLVFLEQQIEELEQYDLKVGEYDSLAEEYNIAKSAEQIAQALNGAHAALSDDDSGALNALFCAENLLEDADVLADVPVFIERLNQARLEIQDIADSISDLCLGSAVDEQRSDYVIKRFERLEMLRKRYAMDIDELCVTLDNYKSEKDTLESSDNEIERLANLRAELLEKTTLKAKELSIHRQKIADDFCQKVAGELEFLNMPGVRIVPYFEKGKLTINGMDVFELMISANMGEEPKPISKIASGGELSRIMLALKNVIADKDSVPTLIFDEIDAGVSGKAAQKIGIKLKEIAKYRQVICVTHLAQIAVMAHEHILIEKGLVDDRTETNVKSLDFDGRVLEIARIMGGDNPSDLMLENARVELEKYMG